MWCSLLLCFYRCRESDNCPTIGSTATRINTPVDKPTFKYKVGAASTAVREEPLPVAPPLSLTICTRQTESGRAERVMVDRCVCGGGGERGVRQKGG